MPLSWASFNNAPRRIQNGGWARQVTQDSFAVADTISGVNMRLTAGGIREMHRHQFAEWAYMTYGTCRITTLDELGRPYIADVKEGDLWYFPAGLPHSLQGLGPDGCEFLICFDEGKASEFTTLLVSEWFTHTPPDVLAENFGVPAETFQDIPLRDLYIFQGKLPGDLAAGERKGRAAAPVHLLARIGTRDARDEGRFGADRRQPELHRFHNDRRRAGDGASRRLAGDALASQRR
jgi:oxalate decarboxylase